MTNLPFLLLLGAAALFGCVACNKLSRKLGVPALLAFLLLGMVFGSDGFLKIPFDDYALAETVCSVALLFIMFYGGFGTNWHAAKPVAGRAVVLSSAGVVLTALLTGVFCHYVLQMPWLQGLLLGAVLGSTDAASVFSILRARGLALKENTASLLEVESGSNDPFAYMMTAVLLGAMQTGVTVGGVVQLLAAQLGWGLLFGFAVAWGAAKLLKTMRFGAAGFDAIFMVAVALLAYAAPAVLGGNGYLSVYIAGIVLGNSEIRNKNTLVPFFDGVTGLMQMLLFFLLGLLAFPSQMPRVLLPAVAIALFLTFVARPAAVFVLLAPFKSSVGQKLLVSWSGLRGAASIVFAVMVVISPASTNFDLFHIVFLVVLLSITVQGTLLPVVAKRLKMLDTAAGANVLKTFTDYTDEAPVQFIEVSIPHGHPWAGCAVRELVLPPATLLVALQRGETRLLPNGSTVLQLGDVVILCAMAPTALEGVCLTKKVLDAESAPAGTRLRDLPRHDDRMVMLVERHGTSLIPNGDTMLLPGDVLVIQHHEG